MTLATHIAKEIGPGYRAWCPALPGCVVFGRSAGEARDRITMAVRCYVATLETALPRELGRLLESGQGVGHQARSRRAA